MFICTSSLAGIDFIFPNGSNARPPAPTTMGSLGSNFIKRCSAATISCGVGEPKSLNISLAIGSSISLPKTFEDGEAAFKPAKEPPIAFKPKYKGRIPKKAVLIPASNNPSSIAACVLSPNLGLLIPSAPNVKASGACANTISTGLKALSKSVFISASTAPLLSSGSIARYAFAFPARSIVSSTAS